MNVEGTEKSWAELEQAGLVYRKGIGMGSRYPIINSKRLKHTLSPDMLFDLEW